MSETKELFVSIIIPVYNVEPYLEKCLDSVISQSLREIEIICVEDGSEDGCLEILSRYEASDNRIRIYKNDRNRGLSYSRNRGMEHAKGEYIWFVDSDDSINDPLAAEKLYREAKEENLDILFFNMAFSYESEELKEKFLPFMPSSEIYGERCDGINLFTNLMAHNSFNVTAQSKLFRREFLSEKGLLFHEIIYEDVLFSYEALLSADWVKHIPYHPYQRYRRNGSITSQPHSFKCLESYIIVYLKCVRFLEKMEVSDKLVKASVQYLSGIRSGIADIYIRMIKKGTYTASFSNAVHYYVLEEILRDTFHFIADNVNTDTCRKIMESTNIIVYGAGEVSVDVIRFLRWIDVKEYFVAVTKGKREGVYELKELLPYADHSLLLISTMGEKQKEMEGYALNLGFKKYLLMC